MKTRAFVSLALVSLLGCTDRIQEGGFETSDLQAHVKRPDGSPVVAARVWLVRSRGDSAAAVVIDSALTDTAGKARFLYEKGADLSLIGLDAQSGDSLGLAPSVFAKGAVASIALQETKSVQIGRDSTGALLSLHVPGSHFASKVSENSAASVLALPKGTWDVAFVSGTRVQVVHALAVQADTVLAGVAGVKAVVTDTSTKVPDTLRDGPDIDLDSFRVDGVAQYVDTSLPPAWAWSAADSSLIEEDTGWTVMSSKPYTTSLYATYPPGTARIASGDLPSSGTLALTIFHADPPSIDSSLSRVFEILESSGNGAKLFLFGQFTKRWDSLGVVPYGGRLTDSSWMRIDTSSLLDTRTWYFSWTPNSVTMRSENGGVVGSVQLTSVFQQPPHLQIVLLNRNPSASASMRITKTRLYKPK